MRYYGISGVKWNGDHSEVIEAVVHRAVQRDEPPHGWGDGVSMAHNAIANLIVGGDEVWLLRVRPNEPGVFEHFERVRVKPGQHEYIESYGDHGNATDSMNAIPEYD